MIVDAHTHLLPHRMAVAVRDFFAQHIPGPLAYPIDHRRVLDSLHADGIDTVWNLPYAHKPGMAADLNRTFAEITATLADHPVAVVTGCTVHPGDTEPAADLSDAVRNGGARFCKLHCSVGGYAPDEDRLTPVWDRAGSLGVPVVIHAGHAPSGHTAVTDLAPLDVVARRHPDTTIVLAHLGHDASGLAVELLRRHPNLWADLTPVVFEPVALTGHLAVEFGDRLLFGSDAPNTAHRAGQLVANLRRLEIPQDVTAQITGGNARRLLDG